MKKSKSILTAVLTLFVAALVGAFAFSMFNWSADAGALAGVTYSLGTGYLQTFTKVNVFKNFAFMAIIPTTDVDAIAKYGNKNAAALIGQVLNRLEIFNDMKVNRLASREGTLLPKFKAEAGQRPLNTNIEENGRKERSFGGRKLYVYDAMKLFKIIPEDLRTSYLSDMLAPGALKIPFEQWVWEKEMEMLESEINDNSYLSDYAGDAAEWDAGTAYTYSATVPTYKTFGDDESIYKLLSTTTAAQSPTTHPAKWEQVNSGVTCTGIGTIIADEVAATSLPVTNTGAITASNALDKVELIVDSMTVAHRKKGGVIRVSPLVYAHYLKQEKAVFPTALTQDMGDGKKYVYGQNKKWEIREASWMGISERIIATQFDNLVAGTNLTANPGLTKTVQTLHGYKSVAKWLIGFEIADLECLYVNERV